MATTPEIRLPADALRTLRHSLVQQVGSSAATRALQEAGHAAGDWLVEAFADRGGFADLSADAFWGHLNAQFQDLGWGSVEHEAPHPGVGALIARQWFEAGEGSRACPFTTGVLANLLGHAAGDEVAVLQVPCNESGPDCVRFLFGAPEVLDRVYRGVREGGGVEAGIAALG